MSKYNANKVIYDDIKFDSAIECRYYIDNIINNDELVSYWVHPNFELLPKKKDMRATNYVADFVVELDDKSLHVIDVKGMATPEAILKRKMFLHKYNYPLWWVCFSKIDGGWIDYFKLKENRKQRKKAKLNVKSNK